MSVAFRSESHATATATATVTVARPTGLAAGDLMVAFIVTMQAVGLTWPSGWTQLSSATINSGTQTTYLGFKVATSSEPTSYPFVGGASSSVIDGEIVAYSGCSGAAPIVVQAPGLVTAAGHGGGSARPTDTMADSYVSSSLQLGFWASDNTVGGSYTPPASWTSRRNQTGAAGAHAYLSADNASPAPGSAVPAAVATVSAPIDGAAFSLILRPPNLAPTVKTASTGYGVGPSVSCDPPVGYVPGCDVLYALVNTQDATASTTTGGGGSAWTTIDSRSAGGHGSKTFYRASTGSDKLVTNQTSGVATAVIVVAVSGASRVASVDVHAVSGGSGTSSAAPTVTTTGPSRAILYFWGSAIATFLGAPAGTTFLADAGASANDASRAAFENLASPGTTSVRTQSVSGGSTDFAAFTIAVPLIYTAPLAPTLTTPANASYQDLAAGSTFTWVHNPGVPGDPQVAYALRRKISGAGSYEYWNAGTVAWQGTIVWNTSSSQSLTFGAALWTDGNVYNWSVATQGSGPSGINQGVFASDSTVTASAPPTVTATAPSGTTTSSSPTVTWTKTLQSGATQTSYQVVVESGAYGSVPGSGTTLWDSGVVSSAVTSAVIAATLLSGGTYRFFVRITETGGQQSGWSFTTSAVSYNAPAVPLLTGAWDDANARVVLNLQGLNNILDQNTASIETDASGWPNTSNCAVARSTAQFLDGSASLAMTSTAAGSMYAQTLSGTSGFPVVALKNYTALVSFRTAVSARSCHVEINWYDAAGLIITSSGGTPVTDSTSGFTQASLTAGAPVGAAFALVTAYVASTGAGGEVHYADEISLAPGSSTIWTVGGIAASTTYLIERSIDGISWQTLRGAAAVTVDSAANQQATIYDYELPAGITAQYRATASAVLSGSVVASDMTAPVTVTASMTSWWLKDPNNPSINHAVCDAQQHVRNYKGDSTAIYPAGRALPLVLKGPVHGADGSFRVVVSDEASRLGVGALFIGGDTMLLQDPRGRQWYIAWVGDLTETQMQVDKPIYALSRSWVEVDVPG